MSKETPKESKEKVKGTQFRWTGLVSAFATDAPVMPSSFNAGERTSRNRLSVLETRPETVYRDMIARRLP